MGVKIGDGVVVTREQQQEQQQQPAAASSLDLFVCLFTCEKFHALHHHRSAPPLSLPPLALLSPALPGLGSHPLSPTCEV